MKILFFSVLILILLLAIFGGKFFEFKEVQQDVESIFKKENHADDTTKLKEIAEKDSGFRHLKLGLLFLMISSAISLKLYDYNNQIWNRMIFALIWPITSGVIIHVS